MAVKDDIRKFELEINAASKNGETLAQITKLSKETAKLRTENEQLEKTLGFLRAKGQQNTEEYKRMSKQLTENKKAIKENGIAMKGLQKSVDLNVASMNQLRSRANQLRSTLNATSKAADPETYNRLETELNQVSGAMDKLKNKSNKTKGLLGKLKGAAGGLLPAFGWTAIITGAIAAGKKILALAKQTGEYRKQVQKLTGESGPALVELTADLEATSKTFKKDFDALAVATNNFAKSMNISQQEANDLINKGFIAGADASDEFIDRLREYGPQFEAAGISAEQAIAIMTQEVKEGVYSDKGTDAIKEATLALREMPQTARDAIDGIGLSSKEMMEQLSSGQITVFDAMQQVSRKMGELPPQSKEVGRALADIFKGAGEDAGLDYILMLGDAQTSMDDLITQSGKAAAESQRLLEVNQELALEWGNLLGEGTGALNTWRVTAEIFVKDGIVKIIRGFRDLRAWFNDFYNNSAALRGIIQGIGAGFKATFNIAKTSLLEFWELLKGLGNSAKAILTGNFDEIGSIWDNALTNMKQIAEDGTKALGDTFVNAWNKTVSGKIETPLPDPEQVAKDAARVGDIASGEIVKSFEKNKKVIKQKLAEAINVGDLDSTELEADADKQIQAAIAFEQAKADAVKKYKLFTLEELQAEEMAMLQQAYDEKLISEQIFQEAKLEMERRFAEIQAEEDAMRLQEKIAKYQEYIAIVSMSAQGFSQVVSNLQAAEFEDLESRRERGIVDEKQYEQESLAIKKKYADKQFIVALANIAASTAQGIMQAYANFDPITATILAAIPLGVGITQGVLANKQRQRVKQLRRGKYGYDVVGEDDNRLYRNTPLVKSLNTGLRRTPTLVAEEPEIVVSTKDTARVMGHNPMILNAIKSPESYNVVPQRQRGNVPETTGTGAGSANLERMVALNTAIMQQIADEGIQATAYYDNDETRKIKDQQDEDSNLLNETSFN